MRGPKVLSVMIAMMFAASAVAVVFTAANADDKAFTDGTLGEGGDVLNKLNFGGAGVDIFRDVIKVPGGFVAVGCSDTSSFGDPDSDWVTPNGAITGHGQTDAIIVKFTENWTVEWKTHFGGVGYDEFNSVTMVTTSPVAGTNANADGYMLVAVGYSDTSSFGTGSWSQYPDMEGYGGTDAIIVAFNEKNGSVEAAWNFGGAGNDEFYGVAVSKEGNVCAVGYSGSASFGTGSWLNEDWGVAAGHGGTDAIMAVYTDGALAYARNFGRTGGDAFFGVAAFDDGTDEFFFAVGYSESNSFGTGDWKTTTGYGGKDAIIVGYLDGEVYAALNFGGSGDDEFRGVGVGESGDVFAVGWSGQGSFGNGSWGPDKEWGVTAGHGNNDAIIAAFRGKVDGGAEVIGAAHFGGAGNDLFFGVTVSPEGSIVAVGCSGADSFASGDWDDVAGNGDADAIAVGYSEGEFVGAMNFGGSGIDYFLGAAILPNGNVLVAGYSGSSSFGNGDWAGVEGKGGLDAIVVMFDTGMQTSGSTAGNDFPVVYVAIAAVGVIALLGIAYVFVLKKP